jgi:hypothetical protein
MSFAVGDKVRTTREVFGDALPLGTEGVVTQVFLGDFLYVDTPTHPAPTQGLPDGYTPGWALTSAEVERVGA